MVSLKRVWSGFVNSFFGVRLLCFVVVQFTVIHHNLTSLIDFCRQVMCQVTPYALPFLIQNYYFIFIYGVSCVYFFAEVPYLQSKQLYSIMRMGRRKWLWDKLLRVWITAFSLVIIEVLLIFLVMLPSVEWGTEWGKVWYSLALTDASAQYDVALNVPYQIMNSYTPMQAMGYTMLLMVLVTGFIGIFMYVWSMYFSRNSAVLAAGVLCVMTLVFANLSRQIEMLSFVTPLEWMNLMLLDGELCRWYPTFFDVAMFVLLFFVVVVILCTYRIKRMDIHLVKEE